MRSPTRSRADEMSPALPRRPFSFMVARPRSTRVRARASFTSSTGLRHRARRYPMRAACSSMSIRPRRIRRASTGSTAAKRPRHAISPCGANALRCATERSTDPRAEEELTLPQVLRRQIDAGIGRQRLVRRSAVTRQRVAGARRFAARALTARLAGSPVVATRGVLIASEADVVETTPGARSRAAHVRPSVDDGRDLSVGRQGWLDTSGEQQSESECEAHRVSWVWSMTEVARNVPATLDDFLTQPHGDVRRLRHS